MKSRAKTSAAGNVSLEGIEPVGDSKAYKLKISDGKTAYYDMETGLKVQEINTQEVQGQQMTSTLGYGDYQEVSGIKFPFKITQNMGPQTFEFMVKEIKVNEGVDASDFK